MVILNLGSKHSHVFYTLSELLENNYLVDLPLEGASFTWFRDSELQTMSCIDSMLYLWIGWIILNTMWKLKFEWKYKSLFRPLIKIRLDCFYSYLIKVQNKSKCAQWTDTLVHKHEQQTIKLKHKDKGREMQTQDNTKTCYRRENP